MENNKNVSTIIDNIDFAHHNFRMTTYIQIIQKFFSDKKKILTLFNSYEDNSTKIIMFFKTFSQTKYRKFWTKEVNIHEVLELYATNIDANLLNLFSILMHDWNDPKTESFDYCLCEKFEAYELYGESLMKNLINVFNIDEMCPYYDVCLRIINHFLYEKQSKLKNTLKLKGNENITSYEEKSFQCMVKDSLNAAMRIKNEEQRNKILKIFTIHFKTTPTGIYDRLKTEILKIVHYNMEDFFPYEASINSIAKFCDYKFLELIFQLKESLFETFEIEFHFFIKTYQKFYGEYWKVAIKPDIMLLLHLSEMNDNQLVFSKVTEFIQNQYPLKYKKLSMLHIFLEERELGIIFNGTLDNKEKEFLSEFEDLLQSSKYINKNNVEDVTNALLTDKRFTKKLLLGRESVHDLNIFEKILSCEKFYVSLKFFWEKFDLGKNPEILLKKNPHGKYLMDFVMQSNSMNQLASFLSLSMDQKEFSGSMHSMLVKNFLIFSVSGKSLIELCLNLKLPEHLDPNFNLFERVVYFFEEIGQVDIESKKLINLLYENLNYYENQKLLICNLEFQLGYMISYWNLKSDFAQSHKKILVQKNSFFDLLFMVLERSLNESEMLSKIEAFKERIKINHTFIDQETKIVGCKLISVLVFAAIKTNQPKVIDCIFLNYCLPLNHLFFTENMKVGKVHQHLASILLKQNMQLGETSFPKKWLSCSNLNNFLHSRVKEYNEEFIEVDYTFMSNIERQKIQVSRKCDVTEGLLIQEDTSSLEFIEENESILSILSHPIIKTYIDIKRLKYHRIFKYNFFLYMILFLLPILKLLLVKISLVEQRTLSYELVVYLWIVGISYLIIREVFQYLSSESTIKYLKSNILDLTLIACSVFMARIHILYNKYPSEAYFLRVSILVLSAISFTSDNPNIKFPLYLHIFKKVGLTFIGVVSSFLMVLLAFSYSFYIIFDSDVWKKLQKYEQIHPDQINGTTFKNFNNISTSFVKVLTLLSGSSSIEPWELNNFQLFIFVLFIITSSILYNLILGLSVENINEIKQGSKNFVLIIELRKIINASTKVKKFHHNSTKIKEFFDSIIIISPLRIFFVNFPLKIIKFLVSKYIFIHNISKIYVNKRNGEVFVQKNDKYESVLKVGKFRNETFKIEREILNEILDIINKRK